MCGEDTFFDGVDAATEEADQPRTTSHVAYVQRTYVYYNSAVFVSSDTHICLHQIHCAP